MQANRSRVRRHKGRNKASKSKTAKLSGGSGKAPNAAKPSVSKGDAKHYDQQRVIDMFLSGKSIRECAEAQKPMSQVYAHRILTTKAPGEYAKEQARRAADRERQAVARAAKK